MKILKRRRPPWLLPALTLALGAAACSLTSTTGSERDELARNRMRWTVLGPDDYGYTVQRICFCGAEATGPVRVTVQDGVAVSRVYVESGEPVRDALEEFFPTVEGLFDFLLDAFEREAHRIEVMYDPDTGVPLDVFVDYVENVADEEVGFLVTEVPGV